MLKQVLRSAGGQAVLARLAGLYLRLALRSTRWTLHGAEHLAPATSGEAAFIVAFWHERLPLLPALLLHARRGRGTLPRLAVLVSRHADGRLIGRLMRQFDVQVVHGSTARDGQDRGGAAGLRQLRRHLQQGTHVVITPDGPRGPRRVAASGVAQLAALAGVAVLPVAAQTSRRRTLGSWDGMVLPLPLGRGVLVCLAALSVRRDDIETGLAAIAASLTAAAETADSLCDEALGGRGGAVTAALYAGAATLLAPWLRRRLRRRVARGKEIAARLPERRGVETSPRPPGRLIWLHAASVGEVLSLLPVLSELHARAAARILLTTGTVTSMRLLADRLPALGLTQTVLHRFVPLDVPRWAARFLTHWRPDAAGFVESEIWPNLLAAARARAVPLMLINARLSQRSFRHWQRLGAFAITQFAGFALIQAQSQTDAARLRALGARAVTVPGNLKLAALPLPADAAELARLTALLAGRPVWLAASTHAGEEAVALSVHDALIATHPDLLTIIAPRHPERGRELAAMAGNRGVSRRGLGHDPQHVWIADTLGEFGLLYRLAGPVFVGGSLVPHGGQNVLEPARLGCAIAVGPHTANFADAVALLEQAGGLARVADGPALAAWVAALLAQPDRCRAMGRLAAAAAAPPAGAAGSGGGRAAVAADLMQAPAFWQHDGVAARLFSPLSAITAAVTARRVARPGTDVGVPVICIGNATIGGAGKTPVALDVAARLQVRGRRVAFLTRGHGGRSRGVVPVDPARHDADAVGDEPLLLAALAPVFVAADRLAGARAAMAAGAQMLVMDDGLQNPGLVKTLSLLVIDGGAGFGNGRVLPAGPLREPVCAAAARCRAAVLIGADTAGARARLPPGLAVKRARMDTEVAPGQRVVAFAGIGRPEKFFAGLREAGAEVLETHGFADHHRFSEAELRALLHRSETCNARLITTAKDFVRLPMSLRAIVLVAPVRLQWLDPIDDLLDLLT